MARHPNYHVDYQVIELLENTATPERGLTSHQISELLKIPYSTVRKVIRRLEHVQVARYPKSVKGYYWDPRHVNPHAPVGTSRNENQFGKVTADYRPTGNDRNLTTEAILARLPAALQQAFVPRADRFIQALRAANEHSQKFHDSGGKLDRGVYLEFNEAANEMREVAEYFCRVAASYQDNAKFDTPEFWSVFLDD